jgi:hypothetical protein
MLMHQWRDALTRVAKPTAQPELDCESEALLDKFTDRFRALTPKKIVWISVFHPLVSRNLLSSPFF